MRKPTSRCRQRCATPTRTDLSRCSGCPGCAAAWPRCSATTTTEGICWPDYFGDDAGLASAPPVRAFFSSASRRRRARRRSRWTACRVFECVAIITPPWADRTILSGRRRRQLALEPGDRPAESRGELVHLGLGDDQRRRDHHPVAELPATRPARVEGEPFLQRERAEPRGGDQRRRQHL